MDRGLNINQSREDNNSIREDNSYVAEIYEHYYPIMLKTAHSLVRDDDFMAADIVQEAAIKLFTKIDILRSLSEKSKIAYLVTIIRTTGVEMINKVRETGKHELQGCLDDAAEWAADTATVEETLLRREEQKYLVDILKSLPARDRILLESKYFLSMTNEEIAEMLGCRVDRVNIRMFRARNKAKRLLEKDICRGVGKIAYFVRKRQLGERKRN